MSAVSVSGAEGGGAEGCGNDGGNDKVIGEGRGTQRSRKKLDEAIGQVWRERIEVSIAKSRKIRGGNYVQLATVDEDGHPRCRTVVFR